MDIPVVGMYLPFDPSLPRWHPWGVRSELLMARDISSLDSIAADSVSSAALRLLGASI